MSTTQQPIDDGGTAFPIPEHVETDGVSMFRREGSPGMSYRQWLAGMFMQGLVSNPDVSASNLVSLAQASLDMADAMIAEQKKDMTIDRGEGR
jgi:hypothetical protein